MALTMSRGMEAGGEHASIHPFFSQSWQALPSTNHCTDCATARNKDTNTLPANPTPNHGSTSDAGTSTKGNGREENNPVSTDRPRKEVKKRGRKKKSSSQDDPASNIGLGPRNSADPKYSSGQASHHQPDRSSGADNEYKHPDLTIDPNFSRKKRRRTESPDARATSSTPERFSAATEGSTQGEHRLASPPIHLRPSTPTMRLTSSARQSPSPIGGGNGTTRAKDIQKALLSEQNAVVNDSRLSSDSNDGLQFSEPIPEASPQNDEDLYEVGAPKKKTVKLTGNGKLLSSPAKPRGSNQVSQSRRGKSKAAKPDSVSLTLTVRLGRMLRAERKARFTEAIQSIQNGTPKVLSESRRVIAPEVIGPPIPTHPFFLGKVAPKTKDVLADSGDIEPKAPLPPVNLIDPRNKRMSSGPILLKRNEVSSNVPASGESSQRRLPRYPDSIEPMWPTRELFHIRHNEQHNKETWSHQLADTVRRSTKKLKGGIPFIPEDEDILSREASQLYHATTKRSSLTAGNADHGYSSERLPERKILSGQELLSQIPLLLCNPRESPANGQAVQAKSHPALVHLRKQIPNTLSAFDEGGFDILPWTQKYLPARAEEVLQSGPEAILLRDWLQNLTVSAVHRGILAPSTSSVARNGKTETSRPRKRKRKKALALDGFIVDSDEDAEELSELTDPDADELSRDMITAVKRTVVRNSDSSSSKSRCHGRPSSITNAILVSGPHGCGKTAAIYAVAKELGFEVFEINPGSRRSGKDIIDKVGDMTQNHLVQQSSHTQDASSSNDFAGSADAIQRDIVSGKQSNMASFLKPKAKPSSTFKQPRLEKDKIHNKANPELRKKKKPNAQKQSLILLEEVDILYEEDKQFWQHVMSLIGQSRRPVIMTCNDEALVPAGDLPLHAILRFSKPPAEIVTEYLLLLAANEGHILSRDSVSSLLSQHGGDLRSSITSLDFWCQMGVGDKKGGLEWMLDRSKPGADFNENGERLRVASQGTYIPQMGKSPTDEEGVTIVDDLDLYKSARQQNEDPKANKRLKSLIRYCECIDFLGQADMHVPADDQELASDALDPTQPRMAEKAWLDYTQSPPLLQVDQFVDYPALGNRITAYMKGLAKNVAAQDFLAPSDLSFLVSIEADHKAIASSRSSATVALADAFGPIADPPRLTTSSPLGRQLSCFNHSLHTIAEDVAPYIRSIVSFDLRLEERRLQLSNLLSEGRHSGKRARTTRASRAALEGGNKASTRRERWFPKEANFSLILSTGVKDWQKVMLAMMEEERSEGEEFASTHSRTTSSTSADIEGV